MDTELRELCERVGLPSLSGGRVAVQAACKRIAELEAELAELKDGRKAVLPTSRKHALDMIAVCEGALRTLTK